MIKEKIVVPACVRFISDWEKLEGGYSLYKYQYPHILNKQLTGCGYTEYCLRSSFNVVLCSPRKLLLENKKDQHEEDVLYVNNTLGNFSEMDFDRDVRSEVEKSSFTKTICIGNEEAVVSSEVEEANSRGVIDMEKTIKFYIEQRASNRLPYKILVTYDSFRHVRRVLESMGILNDFFVVVDEFQSVFIDSRFKSTTELEFTDQLKGIQKLCFVSATPMMDKYLEMLDEFKNLPYYELDWESESAGRVISPRLEVKATNSVQHEAGRIIAEYLSGNFKKYTFRGEDGLTEIESKEAVLYFNSVKSICQLIKKYNLRQEDCNVLCARTEENIAKVRKAFGVTKRNFYGLGVIPKKGEPHKMFTFCTRTVYLGADFYSTNARSFIFSDANVNSLAVDISLDLPQILGRQRLDENPWKNSAEFYFKPLDQDGELTREDFDRIVFEKIEKTKDLLSVIDRLDNGEEELRIKRALIEKYERDAKGNNYRNDYVAVNRHAGGFPVPVFNNLVMVAEQRAYDIQQVDFRDRFKVFSALQSTEVNYDISSDIITESLAIFDNLPTFPEKMRSLCTNEFFSDVVIQAMLRSIPIQFEVYYRVLGPEVITKLGYQKSKIIEEYKRIIKNENLDELVREAIIKKFQVGSKYTVNYIKSELKSIFDAFGYEKSPKATILKDYFEVKEVRIQYVRSFEILSIKQ